MHIVINKDLASNAALITKGKAIGRLRQEMKQAGFSIGQGTLQRILAGHTGVRMESLQQFADYFGVELGTLLRGWAEEGDGRSPAAPREAVHVPEAAKRTTLNRKLGSASMIRRENLNALCLRLGWVSRKGGGSGSPAELANRLGHGSSYWSDRLKGRKPIGAELAREIEEALNLPKYSLDGDEVHSDFVEVSQLSVGAAPDADSESDLVAEVGVLQFRRDFLRSIGISAVNAALVQVTGASMEPAIRDGAVLLLNRADRVPRRGSVYAFAWGGEMLVRRFQRVGDAWHAVADNADKGEHPDIVLVGKAEGVVQGRAVWVGVRL